ncbi:hypothetical protein LCGC14_2362910 [marine sediment metagenome]|uniref:Uncharacterized protein n=1 Tax=marine sediment metagenome TaxID=412755 RepID=A0A0F9C5X9_9ZZZZ
MKKKVEQKKRQPLQHKINLVPEKTNVKFEFGGTKNEYFGSSVVSIDYTKEGIDNLFIARSGVSYSQYATYNNQDTEDLINAMRKIIAIADALDTLKIE